MKQLADVAACRSGDKGNILDLSLMAPNAAVYAILHRHVTADAVHDHLAPWAAGPVTRYELPRLHALKFVVEAALDGGAARSARADNLGKTLGAALLRLEIPWPSPSSPSSPSSPPEGPEGPDVAPPADDEGGPHA